MISDIIDEQSFDEVQHELLRALLRAPESSPRGMKVREQLAVTFALRDPRARLSTSPARAANYGFAAGEFLWYLRGVDDLTSICYYNKRMKDYSDDGKTLNSAYGKRINSQWADAIATLVGDPDSRRAVMTIFAPSDMRRAVTVGTKDVPCTLALQFFVRDSKLDLHVTMRSNDVVWGLANDLFSFTLFQETMLLDLKASAPSLFSDLKLGTYYHTAGSMHLYERHFDLAKQIVGESNVDFASTKMPALTSREDVVSLIMLEQRLRAGTLEQRFTHSLTGGERWLLDRLVEHRAKRDAEGGGSNG